MDSPPPGPLKRRVVWVERLTLGGVLRLRLETALAGSVARFEARDAAPAALRALALLERLGLAAAFERVELSFARRGPDGAALSYRHEKRLEDALSAFAARALPDSPSSLRRALSCFLSVALLDRAAFLTMAEEAARAEPDAEHEFLLRRHHALRLLDRPGLRQDLGLAAAVKAAARPALYWLRALAASLTRPAVAGDAAGDRDAVWVEYYHDDVGGYISRAFWKDWVDGTRFERVFYNDDKTLVLGPEQEAKIAAFGFRWLDAREPWTVGPASPGELLACLGALAGPGPWWLRLFLFERAAALAVWEAAFRRRRVKAVVQHQDFSWQQDVQAEALSRLGGVLVGLHWAECPYLTEPEHLTTFGVYFAWGVNQSRRLAGKGHDCRDILPCGAWILPRDAESADIKARLGKAEFSIALFDTSSSERIFIAPRMVAEFMTRALELALARPGWKVVLKPKRAAGHAGLPGQERIDALAARLEAEGRLVTLDRTVSPASAGLACDVAFGVGLNTAALLSGAFGGRCVNWDAAGFTRHPLVRDGAGTVVFETLDGALAALEKAAAGDRSIGDFSRWARGMNHFGDRRAPERVGGWLTDFLSGPGGDAGLDAANAAYRKRHGVPADFAERGRWWEPGEA